MARKQGSTKRKFRKVREGWDYKDTSLLVFFIILFVGSIYLIIKINPYNKIKKHPPYKNNQSKVGNVFHCFQQCNNKYSKDKVRKKQLKEPYKIDLFTLQIIEFSFYIRFFHIFYFYYLI